MSYRKLQIPKIDWSVPTDSTEPPKLSKELCDKLKEQLEEFSEGKKLNPHKVKEGLRTVNFHIAHPDIYKVIEDFCLEYDINGKDVTTDSFIFYINDHLGDNSTRKGLNLLFNTLINQEEGTVTPESLHKIIEGMGNQLSEEDVKYIMQSVAEPSKDYNIEMEEFYYIMTKKPEDVVQITKVTKNL